MLAHLPSWPVEIRPVTLDGLTLPAVQGASLALSLAISLGIYFRWFYGEEAA